MLVIDAENPRCLRLFLDDEQQFLALVGDGNNMDFADGFEFFDGTMPIEHRREFEHDKIGYFEEFVAQFEHIRRAIGKGVGALSVSVATGRVEEDDGGC